MNSELIIYKKCEAQVKRYCLLNNNQGLEGYFRDPGFDQNTVRDLEKKQNILKGTEFHHYPGSGIHQNLGEGCEIFLPVRNSGNCTF